MSIHIVLFLLTKIIPMSIHIVLFLDTKIIPMSIHIVLFLLTKIILMSCHLHFAHSDWKLFPRKLFWKIIPRSNLHIGIISDGRGHNFPWADHSEWSEFQNLPTSNFVHCLLEWATLEIRYFRLFRDLVNCFSYDLNFWILRIRTFQFELSPVERGILPVERPCAKHHWSLLEN